MTTAHPPGFLQKEIGRSEAYNYANKESEGGNAYDGVEMALLQGVT